MTTIGGSTNVFSTLGASNHSEKIRADNDYYATSPKAVQLLLNEEKFAPMIWEPACGEGHISKVLESNGYIVRSTDLVYRGYGEKESYDFLKSPVTYFDGDIITNPPFKYAKEFVEKALASVYVGGHIAMFLRLQFLEGKARKEFFKKSPPKVVYVSSSRLSCGRNGIFDSTSNAVAFAWFVWEKGFYGDPVIRWIN